MFFCLLIASLEKQERAASPSQPRLGAGPSPRHRPRKRRPIYRMAPLSVFSTRRAGLAPLDASLLKAAPVESVKKRECEKQDSSTTNNHPISSDIPVPPPQTNPVTVNNTSPLLNQLRESQALEVIFTLVWMYVCSNVCLPSLICTLNLIQVHCTCLMNLNVYVYLHVKIICSLNVASFVKLHI